MSLCYILLQRSGGKKKMKFSEMELSTKWKENKNLILLRIESE